MRTAFGTVSIALATCAGLVSSLPGSARAAVLQAQPVPTEQTAGQRRGIGQGWEASGELGTGFSSTYGFGFGGRLGYTLPINLYLGAQVQAYYGQSSGDQTAHASFMGGEIGYKLFLMEQLELRPYVFMGAAFISQVDTNPTTTNSTTGFAVQPGAMVTYHLGDLFIGADSHLMATPSPFSVALLGTAGANF